MDERGRNQLTGAVVWFGVLIVLVGRWYSDPVDFQPGSLTPDKATAPAIVDKPLVVKLPTPPTRVLPHSARPSVTDSTPPRPETREAPEQAPKAARPESPPPARWIVKVAAYFAPGQARSLVEKLRQAGYDARVRTFKNRKGQTVYSVRVGPYASREAARAAKRRIDRRWRADSLIERVKMEQ